MCAAAKVCCLRMPETIPVKYHLIAKLMLFDELFQTPEIAVIGSRNDQVQILIHAYGAPKCGNQDIQALLVIDPSQK